MIIKYILKEKKKKIGEIRKKRRGGDIYSKYREELDNKSALQCVFIAAWDSPPSDRSRLWQHSDHRGADEKRCGDPGQRQGNDRPYAVIWAVLTDSCTD